MLKNIFMWIADVLQHMKPVNWTINSIKNVCGTKIIRYFYNGKTYKYIGYHLPVSVARGFFAPIKKALWNGKDVTERVIKFAGPRHDFYGKTPDLNKMFYKILNKKWIPTFSVHIGPGLHVSVTFHKETDVVSEPGTLEVTNIFGQTTKYSNNEEIKYTISYPPLEQDKTSCSQDLR